MAKCKSCGADITWIITPNGKKMPLDSGEFPIIPDDTGDVLAVDSAGKVIRGRTCSESEEDERWIYARLSHFATCPQANQHRR